MKQAQGENRTGQGTLRIDSAALRTIRQRNEKRARAVRPSPQGKGKRIATGVKDEASSAGRFFRDDVDKRLEADMLRAGNRHGVPSTDMDEVPAAAFAGAGRAAETHRAPPY